MGTNRGIWAKRKPIPISQQIQTMKRHFPLFDVQWSKGVVVWTGVLQPSELSDSYVVNIRYSLMIRQPEVWVDSPKLVKRNGAESIPHTYARDRLCLFRPRKREWTKYMFIAVTIVPWISLWLLHYEYWLATGEWRGGGEHPGKNNKGGRVGVQDISY
ncbi:hypothetical protein [Cohnella sp. WQ 127256]|uniref:hypothetical protein n=1 Tax=Cohnella sp. WQ 127256 TaxID=2938790 RepID=UPI002118A54C|nr:hypothetical protein [Cohnella sp. WQ 127256]